MNSTAAPAMHRYRAFISYNSRDGAVAKWLHRSIEGYRVPKALLTPQLAARLVSNRLVPVFMDREDMTTAPDLGESIRSTLEESDYLVVVCSPGAAKSRWVEEEVAYFQSLGRSRNILCLIVDGEPGGGPQRDAELECFPPSLRSLEPVAADLRKHADGRRNAKLKLLAGLLEVKFDDLRRRELHRRHRRQVWVSTAAMVGCLVLSALTTAAWLARNEAEKQRQLAEQKTLTAQRTADFLRSLFRVSDPGEARGNSVTAREILDRGVQQIDKSLSGEPAVKAEMMLTMGEVYRGLGLYTQSFGLLSRVRDSGSPGDAVWIQQTLALADLELQRGNLDQSAALYLEAERRYKSSKQDDSALLAQVLLGRGGILAAKDEFADSRRYLDRAQQVAKAAGLREVTVIALETQAMSDFYAGEMATAEATYRQAYEQRVAFSGEDHPKAQESLNGLAAVAYQRREYREAERAWRKVLDVKLRVLGAHHPDLAMTRNNLGRLWLERREYTKAAALLAEAVKDLESEHSRTDDTMVFAYSNLALARMGLGQFNVAASLLEEAQSAALANDHPLQGPIHVYQADTLCERGSFRAGLQQLDVARPQIAGRYAREPWRMAQLETVRASCIAGFSRLAEATRLIDAALPVLLRRWPPDSAFGSDALERAIRIHEAAGNTAEAARYIAMRSP